MKDNVFISLKYTLSIFLFASLAWMIDSYIDYLFFDDGKSFVEVTLFQVSNSELYHRLIVLVFIFLLGFIHLKHLLREKQKSKELEVLNLELLQKKEQLINTNEELSFMNHRFIKYLDNAPYGIIVLHADNKVYEVNMEMSRLLNCKKEELEQLTFDDFIPDFARKIGLDLLNKVDREGKAFADIPYITRFKKIRFWKVKAVKLDGGKKVVFVTDITQRLEDDKSIKESENRFHAILNDIENVAVQGYDKDRNVIYWNRASELLYGYTEKEALGQKLEDLIIPEEMKENVISGIEKWYENNEPIPHGKLKLKTKNGDFVHVYSNHVMIKKLNGKREMFCIDIEVNWSNTERFMVNVKRGSL